MTVQLIPTLPEHCRGVQIIEQSDGKFSVYTESGPWKKIEDEVLLGKDLTEQETFDLVEEYTPPVAGPKLVKAPVPGFKGLPQYRPGKGKVSS